MRKVIFTALALVAFAANSVLCRTALSGGDIDPAGFSVLRLASGAIVLWLMAAATQPRRAPKSEASFVSAALLTAYAIAFSFAFVHLNIAAGALILFGSVQATMFTTAIIEGQRPTIVEYIGLAIALTGLVYLVLPGLDAPSPGAAVLMMAAGISWGIYSLRGRGAQHPVDATRGNFTRTIPFILLIGLLSYPRLHLSAQGVALALLSGGGASALGYVIWYAALQDLNAKHAALVQLLVPVLAATGGVLFLSEPLAMRLILAAILILGGIALAIVLPDFGTRRIQKSK